MNEEKEIQEKIEESSPLGRSSLKDVGLSVAEMSSLVEAIDEILTINEVFSELGEDEYFLYLLLMSYAQKKLVYDNENSDKADDVIKKTKINEMLRDAFNGTRALYKSKLEANLDPLTNIWTRRALEARFKEVKDIIKNSEGTKSEKSAIFCFIDADDFKRINERYGHRVGDKILKKLATLMGDNTKAEIDFVARIGGDEFAILLVFPKTEIEPVKKRVEKIHQQITEELYTDARPLNGVMDGDGKMSSSWKKGDFRRMEEKVSLKISIGVAEVTKGSDTLGEVSERADRLLEQAKHRLGKNIVVFEDDLKNRTGLVDKALA